MNIYYASLVTFINNTAVDLTTDGEFSYNNVRLAD